MVDPRGLATFGVAGLVALAFASTLRSSRPGLSRIGMLYGVALVALFVSTVVGMNAAVLLSGGLASVVLGPIWWVGVSRLLRSPRRAAVAGPDTALS